MISSQPWPVQIRTYQLTDDSLEAGRQDIGSAVFSAKPKLFTIGAQP